MKINNRQIYKEAFSVFKALYGENAQFRDGQYEAIEATLLNRRTLVVQRTGWGKSMKKALSILTILILLLVVGCGASNQSAERAAESTQMNP